MSETGQGPRPRPFSVFQLVVFMSVVFAVLSLLTLLISSMTYVLYGGLSYPIYIIIGSSMAALILVSLMAANPVHRTAFAPFYLFAMLLLASILFAFAASLLLSFVLLAGLLLGGYDRVLSISRAAFPLLILGPLIYGLAEARYFRTVRIDIITPKHLGRDIKVLFFSDLHLGMLIRKGRLGRIVRTASEEKPDAIIIGGDLYDTSPENVRWSEPLLGRLPSIAPTFMITGNHEFFHGVEDCARTLSDLGIRTLRGDTVKVKDLPLSISGIDDPSDMGPSASPPAALPRPDPDANIFSIFAYHRPQRFREAAKAGFDLQIGGHTHWGQLAPFNLATYLAWGRYFKGLHRIGDLRLYTSSGAGTWGPPVRVMAPPEVVIVRIVPG
jgi:uncharacterized protein